MAFLNEFLLSINRASSNLPQDWNVIPPKNKQGFETRLLCCLNEEFCMRESRFADSQIMSILKQLGAGVTVVGLSREDNVRTATLYQCRVKNGRHGYLDD